ncbi:Uncharacterised protein [Yersinia kristensenii]|nr:hypothetical protein AW19_3713 [Yersinia frederiksenii Y225]CNH10713.1 Uncharacterised protein [Yersinia kristensenii]CRY64246.1 Uncharacterised protein [Yersinia kristensenii]
MANTSGVLWEIGAVRQEIGANPSSALITCKLGFARRHTYRQCRGDIPCGSEHIIGGIIQRLL